ncbi:phospholipid/cholesterol/gamma-HCH transport system substrate-binding protein [Chitinivorax tropicus]|uniref:Phospholipid/cholesterol/gamma-HCH transport system substrate-binding protein n=1 Tax=Chitinivorax tropicus TaxID=714531 RepID=A0A840MJW1_9PROT|nr:outer membrane lipid asymmetry maintenance protein MlaD [Chitinivorax tropicus]MBB5019484.1 phospholipid/cholesterol/gamma-HCH transport system substrate-binding protein [Chitinivorax tropicus]
MNRTTIDLWVGIFVTLGIAAVIFLALKVGNLSTSFNSEKTYTITANFDNIGGLKARAPVRSAGVVVGRVTSVQFDTKQYVAVVTMHIDERYPFSKDTSASILTSGLLGEQYIGLKTGGDEENLKDGDKLTITQSAVVLEDLIGRFLFSSAEKSASQPATDKAATPAP